MKHIVTVTLNPSIDKTLILPRLKPGQVNRVSQLRSDPGGKGINVARALKRWGEEALATGWIGGHRGRFVLESLSHWGISHRFVQVEEETRTNLKIVEENPRRVTDINEPGFRIAEEDRVRFLQVYDSLVKQAEIIVLAGSLPRGVPPDFYGTLIQRAHRRSVPVFLDADGEPLEEGIARAPYLVKPNLAEMEQVLGRSLHREEDQIEAGKMLLNRGIRLVALSMGAEGAWFFTREQIIRVYPPDVSVASPVGAGDTMVAALALGVWRGWPLEETVRFATAAGSATAAKEGTQFCTVEEVRSLMDLVKMDSKRV